MRIAIFGNSYKDETCKSVEALFRILKRKNVKVVTDSSFFSFLKKNIRDTDLNIVDSIIDNSDFQADFALSIGGDGSFLKTAYQVGNKGTPILGINTGNLGFLADVSSSEIEQAISDLESNNYEVEQRSVVELQAGNTAFEHSFALNEIAILKQDSSSMITIETHINGEYLHTYQSDGLIIATPTGSTAYSLSVGGPIVVPQANSLVISPVAPHSLNIRPLVIPDSWEIELKINSRSNNFLVSLDGRSAVFNVADKLKITKGKHSVNVIKLKNHTFFNALKNKLMWGIDVRKF